MLRGALVSLLFALGLGGCASVADFHVPQDDEGRPTVSQVIGKIECEISQAIDENDTKEINAALKAKVLAPFNRWAANIILTLTVDDTEGITPTSSGLPLSYIDPLRIAGTSFMFGGNINLYQDRQRIYTETISMLLAEIPRRS